MLGAAERSGLEIDRRRVTVSYGRGLGGSYGSDPAAVALGNMAIEAATQWGSGGAAPSRKAAQAPVGMSMGTFFLFCGWGRGDRGCGWLWGVVAYVTGNLFTSRGCGGGILISFLSLGRCLRVRDERGAP